MQLEDEIFNMLNHLYAEKVITIKNTDKYRYCLSRDIFNKINHLFGKHKDFTIKDKKYYFKEYQIIVCS